MIYVQLIGVHSLKNDPRGDPSLQAAVFGSQVARLSALLSSLKGAMQWALERRPNDRADPPMLQGLAGWVPASPRMLNL